jgi:hypothetical protein
MNEEQNDFFAAMDSGSLWGGSDNQDAGASTQEGQADNNTQDSGQGTEQPALNNETQSQQGTQDVATGNEGNPGSIEFPEGFVLKDVPEHYSPEDAYNMGRYHQSQASRLAQELKQLQQESQMKDLYYQMMQFQASGGNATGATPAGGSQEQTPQKPTMPKRPATEDTYSEEWQQYTRDVVQYQLDTTEYNNRLYESQQKQAQQFQEQRLKAQAAEQAKLEASNEAKYTYHLSDADANAFIQFAQDPNAMNDMALWINAWKLMQNKGSGNQTQVLRNQGQGIREEVKNLQGTATGIQGTGSGVPETKKEDGFFKESNSRSVRDFF